MCGCRWRPIFWRWEPGWCWCLRNGRRICAATTPNTPRTSGWIPMCWPACRCCIPKGSTRLAGWVQPNRCDGQCDAGSSWWSGVWRHGNALMPCWICWVRLRQGAPGTARYGKSALEILERYGDPRKLRRLGVNRLTVLIRRVSGGHWGTDEAAALIDAAGQALALWEHYGVATSMSWPGIWPPRSG